TPTRGPATQHVLQIHQTGNGSARRRGVSADRSCGFHIRGFRLACPTFWRVEPLTNASPGKSSCRFADSGGGDCPVQLLSKCAWFETSIKLHTTCPHVWVRIRSKFYSETFRLNPYGQ